MTFYTFADKGGQQVPANQLDSNFATLLAQTEAASSLIASHVANTNNPHNTTAAQVGAQPSSAILSALAGLTASADKLAYFTGASSLALADLAEYSRGLLADADAATWRGDLDVYSTDEVDAGLAGKLTQLSTLVALKAYSQTSYPVYCRGRTTAGDGYQGVFEWVSSDQSANVAVDTKSAVWVAPDSDPTGASGAWKRSMWGRTINVMWCGAVGNALVDDTAAIQCAINIAQRLVAIAGDATGALVYVPCGQYYVSSTLTISSSFVTLYGDGRKASRFIRNTAYGPTLNCYSGAFLEQIMIHDIGFFHDPNVGNNMVAAHINADGITRFTVLRCDIDSGAYGIIVNGCVYVTIEDIWLNGNYQSGVPGYNSTVAILLKKSTISGIVQVPTIVHIHRCQIVGGNGTYSYLTYPNWEYGIVVKCVEELHITETTVIGMELFNIYIQQTATNDPLLDIFIQHNFLDPAGANALRIDGSAGDGSAYIGKVTFTGNQINGEGQPDLGAVTGSGDAVYIDGTDRGGTYPQALLDFVCGDNNFDNWQGNAINIRGCINASLSNNIARNNNLKSGGTASGIVLGPNVKQATISGGASGGQTDTSTGLTEYGVVIEAGAKKITIDGVDVRLNATGGIQNNTTAATTSPADVWITNCPGFNGGRAASSPAIPASGVDQYNPFGSSALVSVFGGTVTDISINGQTFATTTNVQFTLGPGDKVKITYSVAPSWIWWPQ